MVLCGVKHSTKSTFLHNVPLRIKGTICCTDCIDLSDKFIILQCIKILTWLDLETWHLYVVKNETICSVSKAISVYFGMLFVELVLLLRAAPHSIQHNNYPWVNNRLNMFFLFAQLRFSLDRTLLVTICGVREPAVAIYYPNRLSILEPLREALKKMHKSISECVQDQQC